MNITPEAGRRILLMSFFVALVIVSYQEIHDAQVIPRPRRFVSAGLVYGILGTLAPFISYPLAGLLGVGMVLALVWQHYAGNSTSPVDGDTDSGTTVET